MMKKCFLTGEYVFYATSRAKRPHSFHKAEEKVVPKQYCPFCIENENMTPGVIYSTEDKNIRIVPNRYPFIDSDEKYFGVHDVLIDTADHEQKLSQFSDEHMHTLMQVIQRRRLELESDKRSKYVQIFKNQGREAGASQTHSHWQITSMSVVPLKMEHLLGVLHDYYDTHDRCCYFCNMDFGSRIVEENEDFISYIPADGKFAYGMDILPKRHISSLDGFTDNELKSFGIILRNSIKRLVTLLNGICYNICMYSAPVNRDCDDYFHFYCQIIPRIGHMAGFEFSTGCYINSVLPDDAAEALRNVNIQDK
jgi:UDPglucose--hexose-1-phosphate uridylyltransferase